MSSKGPSDRELQKLMAELNRTPRHLRKADFLSYVGEERPARRDLERIGVHLEICQECKSKMDWFTAQVGAWQGPAGQERLRAFWSRVDEKIQMSRQDELTEERIEVAPRRLQRIAAALTGFLEDTLIRMRQAKGVAPRLALASGPARFASARLHFEATSPDEVFNILIDEEPGRDLVLWITSSALELEGAEIQMSTDGGQSWTTTLRKVADNEVSAKITIGREQRTQMPVEAILRDASVSLAGAGP